MVINTNLNTTGSYSNLESFRAANNVSVPSHNTTEPKIDKVELKEMNEPKEIIQQQTSEKPKKKKRSIIQSFKNFIAGIKKVGIATAEYTVATAKGLGYGIAAACGVLGVDAIVGLTKMVKQGKVSKKVADSTLPLAKRILGAFSTKGKIAAGIAGLAVLGYHWFKASLNVSEKSAAVDHRWGSGHDEVVK